MVGTHVRFNKFLTVCWFIDSIPPFPLTLCMGCLLVTRSNGTLTATNTWGLTILSYQTKAVQYAELLFWMQLNISTCCCNHIVAWKASLVQNTVVEWAPKEYCTLPWICFSSIVRCDSRYARAPLKPNMIVKWCHITQPSDKYQWEAMRG